MSEKIKMGLIATYPSMAEVFLQQTKARENVIGESYYASFEHAVEIAKEKAAKGEVDVILSRGGTAAQIKHAVDVPVVFIPITPFDVIQVVHNLSEDVKEIAFIHYMKNVYGIQEIARMYNIRIVEYSFINYFDIEVAVNDAFQRGIQTVVGGEVAVRLAKKLGMRGYQVSAGREAVERAIEESIIVFSEKRKEQKRAIRTKSAYDSLKEGIIVTDEEQRVVLMNRVAEQLFNYKYKIGDDARPDLLNEACKEVYRSHIETPIYLKKFLKETYAVAHFPIIKDEKFVGVVSRFEDVTKTQELEQKIRKELHQKGFVAKYNFKDIITQDSNMKKILQRAEVYAGTDSNILIVGESGTGKELLAQSIHNASKRKNGPFVAVNCAAIPENLLESELFGYETGAFTGAKKDGKMGLFELAHKGTLFLDEIGEISKNMQIRLLRVCQEKEIMRVGGDKVIPIDVRIISATNQNLQKQVKEGLFRGDLYYRLNVLHIKVPPLRERRGDIALLAENFLEKYYSDSEKLQMILSSLMTYSWPGNIRELQNTIERYGVLLEVWGNETVEKEEIDEILGTSEKYVSEDSMQLEVPLGGELGEITKQVEYEIIKHYLDEFDGNQELAAQALGIGRTTLWRKYTAKK